MRNWSRELGLDPGVDTLARWIAHYIAEQMEVAGNATGEDKLTAERRCFDAILKLWNIAPISRMDDALLKILNLFFGI